VTRIEEIEAALTVAYENGESSGCGCCADDEYDGARIAALETLNRLLPPLLAELKIEESW
jgi:hypothetical protein